MPGETTNGWSEWSKFVLKELDRLNDVADKTQERQEASVDKLQRELRGFKDDVISEIASLKTAVHAQVKSRSMIWGGVAAAVVSVIGAIIIAVATK